MAYVVICLAAFLVSGLTGNQGAFRSAFLIKAGLAEEAFVGTGVAAVVVDVVGLAVYGLAFVTLPMRHRRGRHALGLSRRLARWAPDDQGDLAIDPDRRRPIPDARWQRPCGRPNLSAAGSYGSQRGARQVGG